MTPKQTAMKTGTVYFGDCLKHLKQWIQWNKSLFEMTPSLADLIYLDPPWNSKANYNILFGSGKIDADECPTAQETAFVDMWQWSKEAKQRVNLICGTSYHEDYCDHPARQSMRGLREFIPETGMLAYLAYMAERLALLRVMIKETGSIYLHCDPYASHYLKMIMDDIFGQENFRNEIVWDYGKTSNAAAKKFLRGHDTILLYARNIKEALFHRQFEAELSTRKKQLIEVGYNTKNMNGQRYLYVYDEAKVAARVKQGKLNMETFDIVRNVDTSKGNAITDVWEIDHLNSQSKEYQGYPTQKPLALLNRIIEASTNEGDVVLDPFCGCGTAAVAAAMLKRKFVGIDISLYTVETVTYGRLNKEAGIAEEDIQIRGIPEDLDSARRLAKDDPFAFEIFAVEACRPGMVANKIQRGDKGIDGRGMLLHPVQEKGKKKRLILAQVKAGKPTPSDVRDFANVIRDTKGAVAGVFITLERNQWTRGMQEIADRQGTFKHEHSADEYPRLQHWHIGQFYYKTPSKRLPFLPELADIKGKEMVSIKQTGFLTRQYGS